MSDFYAILKSHIETHPPSFGDGDSVLSMLYEAFAEANPMDDGRLNEYVAAVVHPWPGALYTLVAGN